MSAHEKKPIPDASQGYDHSEPQAMEITLFSAATIVTLILVIIGVQAYFDKVWYKMVQEKVLASPAEELHALRSREDGQLFRYSYTDKTKGLVRVPIDRAMDLYVKEASEGKYFHPVKPMAPRPDPAAGQAPGAAPGSTPPQPPAAPGQPPAVTKK